MPRKPKFIEDYQAGFEYTYAQKNRTTWVWACKCMDRLVNYFKGKHPKEIFVADAKYFLAQRRRKIKSAATLNNEIWIYKAFFNWLALHGVLDKSHNPFREAGRPYVKKSEQVSLSKAKVAELRELLAKALFPLPEDEQRALRLLEKLPRPEHPPASSIPPHKSEVPESERTIPLSSPSPSLSQEQHPARLPDEASRSSNEVIQ